MDGETVERGRSRIDYFRGDAKKYPAWVYDCRLWAIDHDSDDVYDDLDNPFARPRREEYEEVDVPPPELRRHYMAFQTTRTHLPVLHRE